MSKYTYSCKKLKAYEGDYLVTGSFPKELLEAAGIEADPDDIVELEVSFEISVWWDYDIAEPGIEGDVYVKTLKGYTSEFASFFKQSGIWDDLNEIVNEDARDFEGDYSTDRIAAAGDAAYDAWKHGD